MTRVQPLKPNPIERSNAHRQGYRVISFCLLAHPVVSERNMRSFSIKEPCKPLNNLSLGSHTYGPSRSDTQLILAITMTSFRMDGILLFVPTGETERFGKRYDTFGDAISACYEIIDDLHNDPEIPTPQTNTWTDRNGLRDGGGAEEVFGCSFRVGDAGEVQGMMLVSALHDRADGQ